MKYMITYCLSAIALMHLAISCNNNNGTVNFGTPIAGGGGTAFFSLEEPPSLNLQVNGAPEPGSVVLLGSCLGACMMALRRKKVA